MTSAEPAPVATQDDEGAADQVLAAIVDGYASASMSIMTVLFAVRMAAGALLRLLWAPSGLAVAGACLLAVAASWLLPALWPAERTEPAWVQAARIHQRSLPSRGLPAANLAILADCLAQMRRPAYVYVARCTSDKPGHSGTCQLAGVFPLGGRYLVLAGEHLAAGPSRVLAAVLGHEAGHATRWGAAAHRLQSAALVYGWMLIGWAVPWPFVPVAAAGLLAAMTAVAWAAESGCDVRGARTAGQAAMLECLAHLRGVVAAIRAGRPRRQRYLKDALNWLTIAHPPFWLRRAVVRARRA